ncbi:MAG: hypothetical protein ACOY0T_17335 [Myxococcota bacterium]
MKHRSGWNLHLLAVTGLLYFASCDRSTTTPRANHSEQLPQLASNAPVDRVVDSHDFRTDPEFVRLVRQARTELESVRKRFLPGLPPGHHLFVTTTLRTASQDEQVFVAVQDWSNPDVVQGLLSSTPRTVGFREGDVLYVRQPDIIDWTISRPDGSEEGNVLGKFLDRQR